MSAMRSGSMTQASIARRLGVATSTVQRALNGSPRISDATRRKVVEVAREFNYTASRAGRNHSVRKTGTVGVLLTSYTPNSLRVFAGIEEELSRHRFSAILTLNEGDVTHEARRVRQMLQERVRALIVSPLDAGNPVYKECVEAGVPVVFYHKPGPAGPLICDDVIWAGQQATDHLVELGHCRIGFTDCSGEENLTQSCRTGFDAARSRAGLPLDPTLLYRVAPVHEAARGEPRYRVYENGVMAAEYFLGLPQPPTAIVTDGDALTAGVVAVLRDRGLNIPGDISVIAADGDYVLSLLSPRISGVLSPHRDMGRLMASRATDLIRDPDKPVEKVSMVRGKLVLRASTARPRAD